MPPRIRTSVASPGKPGDRLPQLRIPFEGSRNRRLGPDDPFRTALRRRLGQPQVGLENALLARRIPFLPLVDVALDRGDPNPRRVDRIARCQYQPEPVHDDEPKRDPCERTHGGRALPPWIAGGHRGASDRRRRADPAQRYTSQRETDRRGDERKRIDTAPARPREQRQIQVQRITQRGPGKAAQEPAAEPVDRDPGTGAEEDGRAPLREPCPDRGE